MPHLPCSVFWGSSDIGLVRSVITLKAPGSRPQLHAATHAGRVVPGQCPWAGGRCHCPRKKRLHLLRPTATALPTATWYGPHPRAPCLQVGAYTPAQELAPPCASGRKLVQTSPCPHLKGMCNRKSFGYMCSSSVGRALLKGAWERCGAPQWSFTVGDRDCVQCQIQQRKGGFVAGEQDGGQRMENH